ncbi:aldehyde dehydrogenase family protein [Caenispirillum bisanense]|uniref:Aldehyde dehydrogenase (Acceptor) n=1 Tax=Caenispirillum bisanense TaxID=414052 RepID=A0A286GAP7_9PROT|nr:aldehyde dehydrogenase family protein [Caenispirillum bisanense]SOD92595.1 aldehyde dehydrogenase (acceptor) [Caenispirillum bisanense]
MHISRQGSRIAPSAAVTEFLSRLGEGRMLIGDRWVAAADGATFEVVDPATGTVFHRAPQATVADVDAAVAAAREAFENPAWAAMTPTARGQLLWKLADLMEANADELAEIESLDNGKAKLIARHADVAMAIDFLRYMAGWATKIEGATIPVSVPYMPGAKLFAYTQREPVGVVGQIVPWNFPLLMAAWKLGPVLAVGCTSVLKPAEQTPLSALRLGELILEAGYPAGVVNVVTGFGHISGARLAEHPDVDKVAFTGSTEVGKLIGHAAMRNLKRVSLELGGKSPVIVLPDADVAQAVEGAANAIFFNHGQVCTAGSRLYVHRSIFDRVAEGVAGAAKGIRLGHGLDPETQMGPLVSEEQASRVAGYITKGLSEGAQALCGGRRADREGYFVEPTVLVGCAQDATVVREEIFGPVLCALPFDDLDEVAAMANDTPYGLAASVWGTDLRQIHRLVPKIKAGTVWVNAHNVLDAALPFGGFKQSGWGREMGRSVLDLYTEEKSVCMVV